VAASACYVLLVFGAGGKAEVRAAVIGSAPVDVVYLSIRKHAFAPKPHKAVGLVPHAVEHYASIPVIGNAARYLAALDCARVWVAPREDTGFGVKVQQMLKPCLR